MDLTWTKEAPTAPGWYFFRTSRVQTVRIDTDANGSLIVWLNGTVRQSVDFCSRRLHAEYAGPIPEPREPAAAQDPQADAQHPASKERLCMVCGAPIPFAGRRRTCSDECLSKARGDKAAQSNRKRYGATEEGEHLCPVCGKPILPIPGRNYRYRKTCSRACFEVYRAEQASEGMHKAFMRRGGMDDRAIDQEVARARADWDCDGSIADTPETIYGNMITL